MDNIPETPLYPCLSLGLSMTSSPQWNVIDVVRSSIFLSSMFSCFSPHLTLRNSPACRHHSPISLMDKTVAKQTNPVADSNHRQPPSPPQPCIGTLHEWLYSQLSFRIILKNLYLSSHRDVIYLFSLHRETEGDEYEIQFTYPDYSNMIVTLSSSDFRSTQNTLQIVLTSVIPKLIYIPDAEIISTYIIILIILTI